MQKGFTLLEVMISLAIVGGLLLTMIYSLNYHLGVAERQIVVRGDGGQAYKIHFVKIEKPCPQRTDNRVLEVNTQRLRPSQALETLPALCR
jgi:prepilin-type N-terminal cleavage/methylation domain-containing protein